MNQKNKKHTKVNYAQPHTYIRGVKTKQRRKLAGGVVTGVTNMSGNLVAADWRLGGYWTMYDMNTKISM